MAEGDRFQACQKMDGIFVRLKNQLFVYAVVIASRSWCDDATARAVALGTDYNRRTMDEILSGKQ